MPHLRAVDTLYYSWSYSRHVNTLLLKYVVVINTSACSQYVYVYVYQSAVTCSQATVHQHAKDGLYQESSGIGVCLDAGGQLLHNDHC